MSEEATKSAEPVSVVFAREIKPDRIADFEQWIIDIGKEIRQFDGYRGKEVIRPGDHIHTEYVIIARFDTYDQLKAWLESPERKTWVERSREMTVGEVFVQEAHGLEPWFTLPEHQEWTAHSAAVRPPAKYKMAVLTAVCIYPLLLLVSTILGELLSGLPRFLIILATVLTLVTLMTYLVMPWVTGLFRFWLYPQPAADKA